MQFLNSFTADNRLLTLAAAIAAFLVFAVLILLLVRLVFGNRLRMGGGRGRQQRLGVVDAYDMDRQRQLVLVRRDNTEHLIMIGGPNDVLIESTILRVEPREGRERPAGATREGSPETTRIPAPATRIAPPEADETAPAMPVPAAMPVAPPAPPIAATVEPAVEPPPPVAEPVSKPRDFITRMRGRGTPPSIPAEPVAAEPPQPAPLPEAPPISPAPSVTSPAAEAAPAPPTSPSADADFFETEIAKALAPSMRGRPTIPSLSSPSEGEGASDRAAPPLPPRTPFRPFPARRDPAAPGAEGAEGGIPRRPLAPRPPPPPFFSRMSPRPKDRVEPPVGETPPIAPEPVPEAPPLPPIHTDEVAQPAPPSAPPPAHEPEPAKPEPVDPFEEEMARLLGRTAGKDA